MRGGTAGRLTFPPFPPWRGRQSLPHGDGQILPKFQGEVTMDIRSLLASRTIWQPVTETSAIKASQQTQTADVSDAGDAAASPTGTTGAVTGTSADPLGPLSALAMPSTESVARDKQQLGDELGMALAIAGIKPAPPIDFSTDASGNVTVADSDPRAGDIRKVLDNQPELKQRLNKLVSDAQLMEHGDAVMGWYKQVNAGTSGNQANKNLIAAARQIDAATGFTLNEEGLSLDVEGMGAKLMQAAAAPPSDDEKMWEATLRLTDRMRESGVTAAAQEEKQLDDAERKGHARRKGKGIGEEEKALDKEGIKQAAEEIFRKTPLGLAAVGPAAPAETGVATIG
jgi:hypothetical protein